MKIRSLLLLPVIHAVDHAILLSYVLNIREAHPIVKNSSRISLIGFKTRCVKEGTCALGMQAIVISRQCCGATLGRHS